MSTHRIATKEKPPELKPVYETGEVEMASKICVASRRESFLRTDGASEYPRSQRSGQNINKRS